MTCSHRTAAFTGSLLLVCTPTALAVQDVTVVDAAGGPGSDFTSLASAVASAAEGDLLLVRSGSYGAVSIVGKSLTIQADAGAQVDLLQGLTIQSIESDQSVSVRGIDAGAGQLESALVVAACSGPVWIEDGVFSGTGPGVPFPGGGVRVTGCVSVVFQRCEVASFEHQFLNPGLEVVDAHVILHESTVNGVKGFDQAAFLPNGGSFGVRLVGSDLVASESTIVGGAGGNFVGPAGSCSDGGPGGVGLGTGDGSIATLFGTQILGGPGGSSVGTCSQGTTGEPTVVEAGSTLTQEPKGLGTLVRSSPVREGETYDVEISGEPGAFAWLVFSAKQTVGLSLPPLAGELLVSIAPLALFSLGPLPGDGSLVLNAPFDQLPNGVEGVAIFAQLVTLSAADGVLRLGAGTLQVLLDVGL